MLVAQKVNDFITSHQPEALCDGCIVKALGLTAHAHSAQITAALARPLILFENVSNVSSARMREW